MSASARSRTKPSTASTPPSSPAAAASLSRATSAFDARSSPPDALYVHVPFCLKRCAYCDFATAPYDGPSAEAYLRRLARELERVPPGSSLRTIYFGGGTPTSLTEAQLEFLLTAVRARIGAPPLECTCEANPESVTPAKARQLRDAGVNRVSLGAQSFEPSVLQALGRDHAPEHVFHALEILRAAGFTNLSLDLMFAAPGETTRELERDLETLASLDLQHVSAYCLTYETGTPLTRLRAEGRVAPLAEEFELEQYRLVRARLKAAGFEHYEISNFSRAGRESQHNLVYWRAREYFGIGLGAGSYEWGTRRSNTRVLAEYLGEWGSDATTGAHALHPPHAAETLAPQARARELVILGLRLLRGVDADELAARTGFTFDDLYPDGELERLLENGLLEEWPDRSRRDAGGGGRAPARGVRLTERGLELADEVFVELV